MIYCCDIFKILDELLNVNDGSISIGHSYGMSGSKVVGHELIEGKRRDAKYVVSKVCVDDGMQATGLFEVV